MLTRSPTRRMLAGLVLLASVALVAHARLFDFICDDAFISLRYAQNLVDSGSLVYNAGERVEGYTNFVWVVLAALLFELGCAPASAVFVLGALSALTLMTGVALGWHSFAPKRPLLAILPMAATCTSAAVAAWTLSGLETTLYAGLVALGCGLGARVAVKVRDKKIAAATGAVFALAALTRPEGVVPMALFVAIVLVAKRREALAPVAIVIAAFAALVVPFFVWRFWYYGAPLPNTYYLKTTGSADELRERGIAYLKIALRDHQPFAVVAFLGLMVPVFGGRKDPGAWVLAWTIRTNVAFVVFYTMSVGGDFLGLHRFLVPAIPLALLGAIAGFTRAAHLLPPRRHIREAAFASGLVALSVYGVLQLRVGERARTRTDSASQRAEIEPIHWTRAHALRWAATGRWIAQRAKKDDVMAMGAAGAAPFYAGIANVDILGLCDAKVAREGTIVGNRPGHQRRAAIEYTLSRRPVFLFENDFESDDHSDDFKYDAAWDVRGYLWVEAHVTPERHGAPSEFFAVFLMKKERALALEEDPDARVATGPRHASQRR